jgi:hypothetical protein
MRISLVSLGLALVLGNGAIAAQPNAAAPSYRADPQAERLPIDISALRRAQLALTQSLVQRWLRSSDGAARALIEFNKRPRRSNLKLLRELSAVAVHDHAALDPWCRLYLNDQADACAELGDALRTLTQTIAAPVLARELRESADAMALLRALPKALNARAADASALLAADGEALGAIRSDDDFRYLGRLFETMILPLLTVPVAQLDETEIQALRVLYFGDPIEPNASLSALLQQHEAALDLRVQRAIGALAPRIARGRDPAELERTRRALAETLRAVAIALKVLVVVPDPAPTEPSN